MFFYASCPYGTSLCENRRWEQRNCCAVNGSLWIMPTTPLASISLLVAGALAGAGAASFFGSKASQEKDVKAVTAAQPQLNLHSLARAAHSAPPSGIVAPKAFSGTDLLDRGLLAKIASQAGGAIEASGYPGEQHCPHVCL